MIYVAAALGTCPLPFDLSSSVFLPNFQKLRFEDLDSFPVLCADVSTEPGSVEDLVDEGKEPGRRGVRDPRDSAPPKSLAFADSPCCPVDIS